MNSPKELILRPARADDRDRLLAWRNDPQTVADSLTRSVVTDAEHDRWFEVRLVDPDCALLVAEAAGYPVGVVRLERVEPNLAEVHINVDRRARGRGVGSEILSAAVQRAAVALPGIRTLFARIRPENRASLHLFEKAGFHAVEHGDVVRTERRVP